MTRHLLKLVWKRKRGNALVITEILCSFLVLFAVLTFGSAMLMRYQRPLGFDYHDVWNVRLDFQTDAASPEETARRWGVIERVLTELRAMPQVESASVATMGAFGNGAWTSSATTPQGGIMLDRDTVSDEYAKTMRIPLVRGRWFGPEDDAARVTPVVIDADVAEIYFGKEDPVGREVSFNRDETARVIGVTPPFRRQGEFSPDKLYVVFNRSVRPAAAAENPSDEARVRRSEVMVPRNVYIRLAPGTAADFEATISERLHNIDRDLPIRIQHLDQARSRMNRMMLSPVILGCVVGSFLISMVILGLSGVLWQNVTRRTRELGLRRALGATGAAVNRQILAEVALLSTLALIAGVVIVAQLPIVGIFNLVTPAAYATGLGGALVLIYALTLASGLYPGWLAGRVTPADALRYE